MAMPGISKPRARRSPIFRTLWGLDAPQRVDLRASRNPFAEMTDDALREELTRQSRLLAVGEPISAAPPLNEAERNAP